MNGRAPEGCAPVCRTRPAAVDLHSTRVYRRLPMTQRILHGGLITRLVVIPALLIAGCGGCRKAPEDGLSRVHRTGILRVGTDATYPPFETMDAAGKDVVGFDADVIREIARRLGARVEFVVVPFDGILAALKGGKYDCVISAMTITEDRAREVLFSTPYHAAGQSICTTTAGAIRGRENLPGARLGVQLGTTGEREARRVADAEVISFDAIGAAFIDLTLGRLDAVIADTPTAALFAREHPEIRIVGEPITTESYGVAFRMEDAQLKAAVDRAIADMASDGTTSGLRRQWRLEAP